MARFGSPPRRALAKVLLLAVVVGVSSSAAEWILRLRYGPPVSFRFPQEYYDPDPEIGHRLVPRQRAHTHDQLLETNAHGLRDRDYPRPRPAGTRRLLALGDSQTIGNGLALAESWPKLLESRLAREAPESRWEVINAGLEATDTWQHERILERLAPIYDVDGVVLAFYVNDVSEPPRSIVLAKGRTNTTSQRIAYLLKRSALATAVLGTILARRSIDVEHERRVITGEPDPRVERGWAEVERALTGMKSRIHARDAALLIAVLPRRDQVDGRLAATAYNVRIAQIARRLDIPTVDLLEPLRRAWSEHGAALFIPWDGHNSALANEVIARELTGPARALIAPADEPAKAP